ncbi:calcium-activated potassium channel subunit beta-4 isoform X2 [Mus musculus]|uniref:calcium-activated potassium channel subunit beta-4 isoform X2 n=1 Tax=Mus musculus TaxID=10090 RepID=UPI00167BFE2A|nr:calcium-activated potassium channel subunit beta-4 isoform X2 [Mus musculus]
MLNACWIWRDKLLRKKILSGLICIQKWNLGLTGWGERTRGRSPTAHTRRDCSPALLPLAGGGVCGGCSHRGPDHLCQEPGGQGGSHEETQVLLTGRRRIVGSRDQRLPRRHSPALQSPHLVAQEMEGAARGPREAPPSSAAETGTVGRLGGLNCLYSMCCSNG